MTNEYAGGLCAAFFVLLTVFLCTVLGIGEQHGLIIALCGVLLPLALSVFLYRNYVKGGKIILRITTTLIWAVAVGAWGGIAFVIAEIALGEIEGYLLIGLPILMGFAATFSLLAEAATVLLLAPEKR